jgi:hypothetical protein
MAFDLQHFISVREGPNVHQGYDALWGDYKWYGWRATGFDSHPVQYWDNSDFDDTSNSHLRCGGARLQKRLGPSKLFTILSKYQQGNVQFRCGEKARRCRVAATGRPAGGDGRPAMQAK